MNCKRRQLLCIAVLLLTVVRSTAGVPASQKWSPGVTRVSIALDLIKMNYVEPFQNLNLFAGCTSGLKHWVAENAKSADRDNIIALENIGSLTELQDFLSNLKAKDTGALDEKTVADTCIRGMVATLDKHSTYYDQRSFEELRSGTGRRTGATGLEVSQEDNVGKIVAVIENTPAHRAGLRAGDLIQKINDVSTQGLPLKEIIDLLRGTPGSRIIVTVARKNASDPLRFELIREVITVPSVSVKLMPGGYLYVRVSSFQNDTLTQLANALRAAQQSGRDGSIAIILDLRKNPGGILSACIGTAAAFLPPSSLIMSTSSRMEPSEISFYARREFYGRSTESDPLRDVPDAAKMLPMAVLVSRDSAACAEVVAAALQDHKRAKIIGDHTLGWGTVQSILLIDNSSALKLTSGRFRRPNGELIDLLGITPDVRIERPMETIPLFGSEDDTDVIEATKMLTSDSR